MIDEDNSPTPLEYGLNNEDIVRVKREIIRIRKVEDRNWNTPRFNSIR